MPPLDEETLNEAEGSFDDPVDLETADFGNDLASSDGDVAEAAEPEFGATAAEAPAPDDAEKVQADKVDGEAEAEGEAEAAAEGVAEEPKREPMIPKSRLDSYRRRLREAEAKLEEQAKKEAENPPEPEAPRDFDSEIAALSKDFTAALADNDAEKAAELNQKMMGLQAERVQSIVEDSRTGVISESRDSLLTDTIVDDLVSTHAVLNPDSDKFDQELVTRINDMRDFFEQRGLTESQALVKTMETVMPQAFEQTPTSPQATKTLAKKIEAAGKQPPNANDVGEDAPTYGQGEVLDPMKLTLDDLDKVSDEQWAEMCGDNL